MDKLAGFQLYLLQTGRKPSTVRAYLNSFKRLLSTCPDLSIDQINTFLLEMKQLGRTGVYLNSFIDTLRIYGKYTKSDIYNTILYFKEESFMKATMSDEEIDAFLTLPPTRKGEKETINYNRWTLFFSIMAFSGMRCGEVAGLTVDRVDFGRTVFVLEDTKTNTPRYVPISQYLLEKVKIYIETVEGKYLFPSKRGGKRNFLPVVDDVDWHYNFHTRLKRLGIKRKNLSPYSLRHSFITRMLEEDVNIFKVQKIVGHRQLETTSHYTHLTTKDIVKTINKDRMTLKYLDPKEALKQYKEVCTATGLIDDGRFSVSMKSDEDGFTIEVKVKT